MLSDLIRLAETQTAGASVAHFQYEGQVYWAKRRPASKQTMWHALQAILTKLIPLPILRPTATKGGPDSLQQEAARYRLFAERHIPVPNVAVVNQHVLVLTDSGQQLKAFIDQQANPAQRYALLQQTIVALAQLHQAGLAHGRPLLRDMTIQDGVIHFIDLEEDPTSVMSIAQAQARDVWLFLNGVARYMRDNPAQLYDLYIVYTQRAPQTVQIELSKLVQTLKPIRALAQYLIMPFAGKDVWQAVQANKILERYFAEHA